MVSQAQQELKKTGLQWAAEEGRVILDPDGFGERNSRRPHMADEMSYAMYSMCMRESTCSDPGSVPPTPPAPYKITVGVKFLNAWDNYLISRKKRRTYRKNKLQACPVVLKVGSKFIINTNAYSIINKSANIFILFASIFLIFMLGVGVGLAS